MYAIRSYYAFRNAVQKILALPPNCMDGFTEKAPAQKLIGQLLKDGKKPLLLIERELNGVLSVEFISYLRNDHPDLKMVVLTTVV